MQAFLESITSFMLVTSGDKPFSNALVHYLAMLGINTDTHRPRTAKNYSYILAGVVYCIRVLSIEKLLPATLRDEQTDEDRVRFLQCREKYLSDGSYSPMSEALSLLAYGKHIAFAEGNSGNAYWSKDKTTFYLHGQPIRLNLFRSMAQDMVTEVEQMLWEELLWVTEAADRFSVKLKQLVDDVTFTRRGEFFGKHRSNGLADKLEWMLNQVERSEEGKKLQTVQGSWDAHQVRRYLRLVEQFLTLLMVCVHVTSGQPGRGSEITSMRFRNGLLQDRNLFVVDGDVMTVARYHKSQSQWDKPKIVPRFLPARLGQVVVVYLAYLQPFQEYLNVQGRGAQPAAVAEAITSHLQAARKAAETQETIIIDLAKAIDTCLSKYSLPDEQEVAAALSLRVIQALKNSAPTPSPNSSNNSNSNSASDSSNSRRSHHTGRRTWANVAASNTYSSTEYTTSSGESSAPRRPQTQCAQRAHRSAPQAKDPRILLTVPAHERLAQSSPYAIRKAICEATGLSLSAIPNASKTQTGWAITPTDAHTRALLMEQDTREPMG
ncbi:hypothetical protein DPSP01_014102 [Paraphaeosphaeria sporulosa]